MMQIGMPLSLEKVDDNNEIISYRSRIVEVDDTYWYIDYPVNEKTGKVTFVLDGVKFAAWFVGAKDQAVYRFFTEVLERVYKEIPMLKIKKPMAGEMNRIQRRQYVRVETAVNVACHPKNEEIFKPFVTVSEDISAGGMSLFIPKNSFVEENAEINLFFALNYSDGSITYFEQKAKVIRTSKMKGVEHKKRASIEFIDIDEKTRQTLVHFCFQQQLKMKKKGIL